MRETITELGNLWNKITNEISQKVQDPRFSDVFLSDSYIYSFENNSMVVAVNSNLAVTILSTKYDSIIHEAVKNVTGTSIKIKFDIVDNLKKTVVQNEDIPIFFKNTFVNSALNFDTFVTGPCNLEAKQAALLIATNASKNFNPLYIYSNPGLGKTHLLHAIANYIKEMMPTKKALYCEATDFIQEYINYVNGEKRQDDLKSFICDHDILLIDDIQMLSTKEQTCMFFFDIFNSLYSKGKQIVVTSDKHSYELKGYFEERLKSRLASGLTVSITQPDVSTCVSILKSKINHGPLDINTFDEDVLEFIAGKFSKNIRDIDQALTKLLFYTTTTKPTKHIDMETALEALQSLIDVKESRQKLSEQKIIGVVSEYYNLTPTQITGQSRQGNIALARHVAMYLIRSMLDIPFTRIGLMFGGKDHSTVMNGVTKVEKELKTNQNLLAAVTELKSVLKS